MLSLAQTRSSRHGNSILEQPGPAEALKQVLFRLQAVEAELQQQKASVCPAVEIPEQQVRVQAPQGPTKGALSSSLNVPAFLRQEAEAEPGRLPDGLSLQR